MRAIWTISVLLVAAGLSVGAGMLMFHFATVEPEFAGLGSFVFDVMLGTLFQIGLLISPFSCDRGVRRRVIAAILMLPAYLLLGLVAMDILGRFMRGGTAYEFVVDWWSSRFYHGLHLLYRNTHVPVDYPSGQCFATAKDYGHGPEKVSFTPRYRCFVLLDLACSGRAGQGGSPYLPRA